MASAKIGNLDRVIDSSLYAVEIQYYANDKRKWLPGELFLTSHCFLITCDDLPEKLLEIKFRDCDKIAKANSSLIFRCVVISSKQCHHWISSNENRDFLFSTCEHFWRESLFNKGNSTALPRHHTGSSDQSGELGNDILRLVHDSEESLSNAASALHEQGHQLDDTLNTSRMIENDLGVSEKVLRQIKSPFLASIGRASQSGKGNVGFASKESSAEKLFSYNILYCEGRAAAKYLKSGTLKVSNQRVVILDADEGVVQTFMKNGVASFDVVSPWSCVVTKCKIGERDVCFRIHTARMAELLKLLHRLYHKNIRYTDVDDGLRRLQSSRVQKIKSNAVFPEGQFKTGGGSIDAGASLQKEDVSEAEAQDILQGIMNLKKLAVAIGEEQDHQDQVIDELRTSVDQSDLRMNKQIRTMNKLMR